MDMTIGMVSMKVSNLSPNRRNMAGCWVEEQITGPSPICRGGVYVITSVRSQVPALTLPKPLLPCWVEEQITGPSPNPNPKSNK